MINALHRIIFRLKSIFSQKTVEEELKEEIQFHLDQLASQNRSRGISEEAARRQAEILFGGSEQVAEVVRSARGYLFLNSIKRDISAAIRFFVRTPTLAAIILVTLAVGIGAFIAVSSVVYGVLLRPFPFPEPERLVEISETNPSRATFAPLREGTIWDMSDLNHSLEEFGVWRGTTLTMTGPELPEQLRGASVSVGFFRALAVQPVVGRLFESDEDGPAAEPLALLSHSWWTTRFAGDPQIVGRRITLNGKSHMVVGVLPAATPWLDSADVFVPLIRRDNANRLSREYSAIGRLKPDVSLDSANEDFSRIVRELRTRYPEYRDFEIIAHPTDSWSADPNTGRMLWILLGAVGFLLVIACVNVTNLLLARTSARVREAAVRVALGATDIECFCERFAESLSLSIGGGVAGWFTAMGLIQLLRVHDPSAIPRLAEVRLNIWTVALSVALIGLVAAVTAVAPALHFRSRKDLTALVGNPRIVGDKRKDRIRSVFVAVEVALTVVVLVGTGLLTRSFIKVLRVDRGFQAERRLVATISLPAAYEESRRAQIASDILSRVERLPAVVSLGGVSTRPLEGIPTGMDIIPASNAPDNREALQAAQWRRVTAGYFKTMGVPVVAGGPFTEHDLHAEPWHAILSKRLADLLWPGENPVGKTALLWKGQLDYRAEIVGVVADMRERGLESDPPPTVYLPLYGVLGRPVVGETKLDLVIHTKARPQDMTADLRAVVAGIDKTLPVSNVRTLEDIVADSVATRRLTMLVLGTFAVAALLLAVVGVCSVLWYSIACRRPQIGIRVALGASHTLLLREAIIEGMAPVVIGSVIGMIASYGLSHFLASLVFGITVTDLPTYLVVGSTILAAALIACYLTARQILTVAPAETLRIE